ncbi:MAG: APC family permease [Chloroflexi bacterium]|nr:APC family permease [Chloroflexota bacterium]
MIGGRRPLQGRKPGDKRVRVERKHAEYFRYDEEGVLVAKPKAHEEHSAVGRTIAAVRRAFFGAPLSSEADLEQRLDKKKALAIFSSDAISSSAYATEEILRVLVLAGAAAMLLSIQVAMAIAALLFVVAISYRQVCFAYPTGGGSYSVAGRNFGRIASLVAASALIIDYVLTVAVSTSSAVEQIVSAVPGLKTESIVIGVAAIALITLGNLRGLRESGSIFALPTYLFLGSALLMIGMGVYRILVEGGGVPVEQRFTGVPSAVETVGVLLLLKAFAGGSVALTGTEAIATGVNAFKPPESRNAANTLMVMAALLAILFIGITFLAVNYGIFHVDGGATVIAQVSARIYGDGSLGFYAFQLFTALLLFLAANTSFNAFPRLVAILGQDGFMPRQFSFRGDRLSFTMGIVLLGILAASLVILFGGVTHALIPLYSVGVFLDFTISQSGMVRHWLRERGRGWQYRITINTVGAVLTGIVLVVVTFAKAPQSLLVLLLIPLLVGIMLFIRREYDDQADELAVRPEQVIGPPHRRERVILPVPGITRAVVQAVNFGRSLSDDVRAVHVTDDAEAGARLRKDWERQIPGVPLVIVESPFRALVQPFLTYLDVMVPPEEDTITIVVLPEYVARHWWERLLYNQTANRMREALVGRPDTVVANVPYRREKP